jgi:hypothetical protein
VDTLFDDVCGSACRSRARSCPQREIDFGGCRCQAALLTGDEGSTDPVCSLSPRRRVVDDILGKPDGSDNFSKWMPRRNPTIQRTLWMDHQKIARRMMQQKPLKGDGKDSGKKTVWREVDPDSAAPRF